MAVITITIPDTVAPEAVDALCEAWDWRSIPLDGPKDAFAKAALIRYIKRVTINRRMRNAESAAGTTAEAQATTDLAGVT